MIKEKISNLFLNYLTAFKEYDLAQTKECYALPCLLSLPDTAICINNEAEFAFEFDKIFTQLRAANTSRIVAKKASYTMLSEGLYLVVVDWLFIDNNDNEITDFSAFYHVAEHQGCLKIVSVISHDISQSKTLTHEFLIR